MAFEIKGSRITMDAYDYGIQLPFDIEEGEFEATDTMRFELKKSKDSVTLVTKEYTNEISDNPNLFRFFLEFTKSESEVIPPGNYVYYIIYLKDGDVRDTLVSGETFKIKNG